MLRALSLRTCCRHYPGAADGRIRRSKITHPCQPSPIPLSGRPAHRPFRGLLGVYSRCGLHTRTVTNFVTAIRGLQTFRRLHACPGCFRLERVAGRGLHPLEKRRLVTAHVEIGHSNWPTCDARGSKTAIYCLKQRHSLLRLFQRCRWWTEGSQSRFVRLITLDHANWMTRRELLVLGAGTIALPLTVRAQQRAIPLVGVLRTATAVNDQGIDAFRRGLRELGYVEGHNILVEVRSSGGDNERLPALAAELAALKPDVIVANGEQAISAVKDATANPRSSCGLGRSGSGGLCAKPRSPWRQSYGLTNLGEGLAGKRLELLLQMVPKPGCVAVLTNPDQKRLSPAYSREANLAAQSLGVDLWDAAANNADQFDTAIAAAARRGCRALLGGSDPIFTGSRRQLLALVTQHRIAAFTTPNGLSTTVD